MQDTLLIVGHPGHELRLWGWLCATRPTVCVITDGSGSSGEPRIDLTSRNLREAGATISSLYGTATDRAIYQAVLAHDFGYFIDLAQAVYELLQAGQFAMVAGDAIEGYNPTHDLCRLVIDAAVTAASQHGQQIKSYEFPLMGDPRPALPARASAALTYQLSEQQFRNKLSLVREYARGAGGMLDQETEDTFRRFGEEAFRQEWLFPTQTVDLLQRFGSEKPFFEQHGEKRVAEGVYRFVIRLTEHVLPVQRALRDWSEASR